MTKDELKSAIHAAGVHFKTGLTKGQLQDIYDKIHVHRLPETPKPEPVVPEETEEERLIREAEEDPEPELDKDGNPIDPELGGEGDGEGGEVEKPAGGEEPAGEFGDLFDKIGAAKGPEPKEEKKKPLIEASKRKKKKGESSADSFRIEGYILLLVTDTVFPFAFAFLNNMLDKKVKIEATDLQLSETDFNKLEPLADQAADYMQVNLNPIAGFMLVATFMYGNNVLIARMQKTI